MSVSTIIATAAAVLFGVLWLLRRRGRMRSGDFE